ncbi:50S ribosomal protein L22 [Ferrimicrobium sp.]|uniref:50S ribosomal protein L22 n=1 Tax=Ferrimicrobium sp. TaxID=2926050 RepID=UPI0034501CFA
MAETLEVNQARAVLRYFRMSPTKARQVLDLIRGKSAVDAIRALSLVNREASEVVGKLLASAVANATVRYGLGADEVYVAAAYADEGPTIKRFRPRARGRATRIRKRSCHITIVVEEMPLSMRRVEAARSSGRSNARRAQRVASSRGTKASVEAVSADSKALEAGEVAVDERSGSSEVVEGSIVEDTSTVETVEVAPQEVMVEDSVSDLVVEDSSDQAVASEELTDEDSTPESGQEDS